MIRILGLIIIVALVCFSLFFFFNDRAPIEIYTLSLHDALPISTPGQSIAESVMVANELRDTHTIVLVVMPWRSEEHTSELQSQSNLVCRLLLEKKKKPQNNTHRNIIYRQPQQKY